MPALSLLCSPLEQYQDHREPAAGFGTALPAGCKHHLGA